MAMRLKAEDVGGRSVLLNLTVTENDNEQQWVLGLEHRALHYVQGRHDPAAAASLRLSRPTLLSVTEGGRPLAEAIAEGDVVADGDVVAADAIFGHLDVFLSMFPLVEP